ncbi:MAG: hypothetical protein PHT12_02445 [Patescibacteria group bacterium]|nr:hypothetical protein [Patescibacteria group bacterium]
MRNIKALALALASLTWPTAALAQATPDETKDTIDKVADASVRADARLNEKLEATDSSFGAFLWLNTAFAVNMYPMIVNADATKSSQNYEHTTMGLNTRLELWPLTCPNFGVGGGGWLFYGPTGTGKMLEAGALGSAYLGTAGFRLVGDYEYGRRKLDYSFTEDDVHSEGKAKYDYMLFDAGLAFTLGYRDEAKRFPNTDLRFLGGRKSYSFTNQTSWFTRAKLTSGPFAVFGEFGWGEPYPGLNKYGAPKNQAKGVTASFVIEFRMGHFGGY